MRGKHNSNGEISHEALIRFFRQIILKDWGYRDVVDADEQKVLTDYISLTPFVTFRFLKSEVFGNSLCSKIERYNLKCDRIRGKIKIGDAESMQLYNQFYQFFNPDVLYSHFSDFEAPNLFVLERKSLADAQRALLIQRCESWLKVLYDMQDEEGMKPQEGWGSYLSKTIEHLIAKAEPKVGRAFVRKGEVTGFFEHQKLGFFQPNDLDGDDDLTGLAVTGFKHPNSEKSDIYYTAQLILTDTRSPEKFGHLIGQTVSYHFERWSAKYNNYGSIMVFPHGKLVSVP